MSVTVYALEGCPDCESVLDSLDAHDVGYDVEWVDARFSARDAVRRVSGQRSVPVLVDDDTEAVLSTTESIQTYVERSLA